MPYRDPVHFALGGACAEHPQYAMELRAAISINAMLFERTFRGNHHELPLSVEQWRHHVIVAMGHRSFVLVMQEATLPDAIQGDECAELRDGLANLQSHLVDIYAGDITVVPVYPGGWAMTCDVFLYMRSRLTCSLTWGTFLALIGRAARHDIEFLCVPTAGEDSE